jgi:hypothetical protein
VEVDVEHAVLVIADLGDLVVAQGIGMAIGSDAPYVKRAELAVAINGYEDICEVAALWAKDLDDTALQKDGLAVRLDGESLLVIEYHRHSGLGIVRRGGMCGGEHPVGRLGRAGQRRQRESDHERRGKE